MRNSGVVLDASVAVKLVLEEDDSPKAHELYKQTLRARHPVICPPVLKVEVANAVFQQFRRKMITYDQAAEALQALADLTLDPYEPKVLYAEAFILMQDLSLVSMYDACYVALAESLHLELWTADKKLLNAVGEKAPWVRDISSFPWSSEEAA